MKNVINFIKILNNLKNSIHDKLFIKMYCKLIYTFFSHLKENTQVP